MGADVIDLFTWELALRQLGSARTVPATLVDSALDELRARSPVERTPALVAFTLDVDEAEVSRAIEQVRQAQLTRTQATPALAAPPAKLPCRFGEYELLACLGRGGMGAVYRARHALLEREVALKLLLPDLERDPEGRARFLREARALAAVNHPRVVTCYQIGEAGQAAFLAMELLEAGDAQQLARQRGGRLGEREALELARDAAMGLVGLARAGLLHRDLKPSNLLLDAEGRAKLGDLGLARRASGDDRMTLTGFALGTPAFMAPEQLAAWTDLDARVDVYGLGATLYCLLTGEPPQSSSYGPPDPRERVASLHPATAELVLRCLAREREERYRDARALLEAIEHTLGQVKAGPRQGAGRRIAKRGEEGGPPLVPLLAGGVGAAGLLVGALLALGGGAPERERAERPRATLAPAVSPSASPATSEEGAPAPDPEPSPVERIATPAPSASPHSEATPEPSTQDAQPSPTPPTEPSPAPAAERSPTPAADPPPRRAVRWRAASLAASPGERLSREGETYRIRPERGGEGWSRDGVFSDRLELPLRARWTCQARAEQDAPLGDMERGHGFQEPAGFFYELVLRPHDRSKPDAAAQLTRGAWWITLLVQSDGDVVALVRNFNRDYVQRWDPKFDPPQRGAAILERIPFRPPRPGEPFEVEAAFDARGWQFEIRQGQRRLAGAKGAWGEGNAPITTELEGPVQLWGHFGSFSTGYGTGSLKTEVAEGAWR